MSNFERPEPPDTARIEAVLAAAKFALAAVPIFGGSIAEAVGYIGQREVDKRMASFFDEVLRGLEDMQAQVPDLKESFWTTLFHAAEVARRTHQQEKREALKNAVLNAAKPTAPEDDLQHIFLNMVDDLTPLHLRPLEFFLHPEKFGLDVPDPRAFHVLNPTKPRWVWDAIETRVAGAQRRDLVELCFSDMVNRGLMAYSSDPGPLQGAILPWPTNLALEFIGFITSPNQEPLTSAQEEEHQP